MESAMLYRCVRSGRTLEVNDPDDIEKMKVNESYIALEVSAHSQGSDHGVQETDEKDAVQAPAKAPEVKRRGRPRKVKVNNVGL